MKKLLLVCALLCTAAVCVNAQNLSSLSKAAKLAYNYLQNEGYKPYIDEDNDVVFKVQGYSFYVDNNRDDETYLRIVLPAIKELDDDDDIAETLAALASCNEITRTKKLVMAYMSDEGVVSLATETYIGDSPDISEFVDTSIDFLIRSCTSWREKFKEFLN